mmetsp:Transcript_41651/g.118802  ORF Transcript_41651/g.118802 Transcript_41651/m.118802 type:complete len:216 (+) Transcript_41651:1552-2199(+)
MRLKEGNLGACLLARAELVCQVTGHRADFAQAQAGLPSRCLLMLLVAVILTQLLVCRSLCKLRNRRAPVQQRMACGTGLALREGQPRQLHARADGLQASGCSGRGSGQQFREARGPAAAPELHGPGVDRGPAGHLVAGPHARGRPPRGRQRAHGRGHGRVEARRDGVRDQPRVAHLARLDVAGAGLLIEKHHHLVCLAVDPPEDILQASVLHPTQ